MTNNHVEFVGDLDVPGNDLSLFRYMHLSTLFLLLEGKAFLPSVEKLQSDDFFEGEMFCESPWLTTQINQLLQGDSIIEFDEWILGRANQLEHRKLSSDKTSPSLKASMTAKIYTRELKKRRSAWCWFESEIESAGMWKLYGHKGVAVRTTLRSLQNSLPQSRRFQMAKMRYVDRRPSSSMRFDAEGTDRSLIHRPHFLKAIEFGHEKEVRVVTPCPSWTGGVLVEGIDWRWLVKEIVISPLLPAQEAQAIKTILEDFKWEQQPLIERSSLLPDNSMTAADDFWEAIREDNGGDYEANLPPLLRDL